MEITATIDHDCGNDSFPERRKPYMDPNPSIEYWCDDCQTYHDHGEHSVAARQDVTEDEKGPK